METNQTPIFIFLEHVWRRKKGVFLAAMGNTEILVYMSSVVFIVFIYLSYIDIIKALCVLVFATVYFLHYYTMLLLF